MEVQVVTTRNSLHFLNKQELEEVKIWKDDDEWEMWNQRGDPVLHIQLRNWADVLVISPLDANTLAKISHGICDNLLTCLVRAWDMKKPLLFCPAMNTFMWQHPFTNQQVNQLKQLGYIEIPCISKTLICGDTGIGAMAQVATIVDRVLQLTCSVDVP